jgi:hypothetical protein
MLTSNGGDLILLVGITYTFHLIEEDLKLTGKFADYLHQSNLAFEHQHQLDIEISGKVEELGERLVEVVTRQSTVQSHSSTVSSHHHHQHHEHQKLPQEPPHIEEIANESVDDNKV